MLAGGEVGFTVGTPLPCNKWRIASWFCCCCCCCCCKRTIASVRRDASTISISLFGVTFSLSAVVSVPSSVVSGLRCARRRLARISFFPFEVRLYWPHFSTRFAWVSAIQSASSNSTSDFSVEGPGMVLLAFGMMEFS